jgi:hypothetical protein
VDGVVPVGVRVGEGLEELGLGHGRARYGEFRYGEVRYSEVRKGVDGTAEYGNGETAES